MELRQYVAASTITMSKSVKVTNTEVPDDNFVWEFYLTPDESRKFGQGLMRLADEITASDPT